MFKKLAEQAIDHVGEAERQAFLSQDAARHRQVFTERISAENLHALAELGNGVDLIDVPSVVAEAQKIIRIHPGLRDQLRMGSQRIDWIPDATYLRAVTDPAESDSTPPELRAVCGYTIFIESVNDSYLRDTWPHDKKGPFLWRNTTGQSNSYYPKRGAIVYALGYIYGNRDSLQPARWVAAPEHFEGGKKRAESSKTLWNRLYDKKASAIESEKTLKARMRATFGKEYDEMHDLRIAEIRKAPLIADRDDWQAVNAYLMPPTVAGKFFKRQVGGGLYGKDASAFLPIPSYTAQYSEAVATILEDIILDPPFLK